MARSHGKILASAWQDPDWTALLPREQWMYWTLLGQPKLTLVGVMDYMPARWAQGAGGCSVDYIEATVAGLEAKGFVVVDRATAEILVRTFVRHDGVETANVNIRKGMWGAWTAVASPVLRKVAIDNLPAGLWTIPDFQVPDEAVEMSRSAPWERPSEQASERPSEQWPEPLDLDLPPSPTPAAAARPDDRQRRIDIACRTIAEERALTRDVGPGWINACATGMAKDHHQALHRHLSDHPDATDSDLIDLIEGERKPAPIPSAPQPLPVEQVLDTTKPDFAGGLTLIRQIQESRHA